MLKIWNNIVLEAKISCTKFLSFWSIFTESYLHHSNQLTISRKKRLLEGSILHFMSLENRLSQKQLKREKQEFSKIF
jgi:hypothetical protein